MSVKKILLEVTYDWRAEEPEGQDVVEDFTRRLHETHSVVEVKLVDKLQELKERVTLILDGAIPAMMQDANAAADFIEEKFIELLEKAYMQCAKDMLLGHA